MRGWGVRLGAAVGRGVTLETDGRPPGTVMRESTTYALERIAVGPLPVARRRSVGTRKMRLMAGRPTNLDLATADRLVALFRTGTTLSAAAEAVGMHRTTLSRWCTRALSRDERDRPYVALERRLRAAPVSSRQGDGPAEAPASPAASGA
jgi:hypothetical protein